MYGFNPYNPQMQMQSQPQMNMNNPYAPYINTLQNRETQQQQQMQPVNNKPIFDWVNGKAGAEAYILMPNTTAILMDEGNSEFYIKQADNSGKPSMSPTYCFYEKQDVKEEDKYATKEEISGLQAKIDALYEQLGEKTTTIPSVEQKEVVVNAKSSK